MLEQCYTVKGACEVLAIRPPTLYRWVRDGKLMRSKIGGRTVFRESELAKLVQDDARDEVRAARCRVVQAEAVARKVTQ